MERNNESYLNSFKATVGLIVCIMLLPLVILILSVNLLFLAEGGFVSDLELDIQEAVGMFFVALIMVVVSTIGLVLITKKMIYCISAINISKSLIPLKAGFVDLEKFVINGQQTGISAKRISKLLHKKYLKNLRLERKDGKDYIVLNNAIFNNTINNNVKEIMLKDLEQFNMIEKIKCPSCGADVDIKDRDNVVCSYCNTKLKFKRDVDRMCNKPYIK